MSNPDFSRDPERVAVAKVLREAHQREMAKTGTSVELYEREYLAMADDVITHLGTGIPAATEANAERLAKAKHELRGPSKFHETPRRYIAHEMYVALDYLRALHAMMEQPAEKPANLRIADMLADAIAEAEREKPEPLIRCEACGRIREASGEHLFSDVCKKCAAKPEPVFEGAQGPDAPTVAENATVARDITGEAARRKERQRLVWEATCAMSSLDMSTKSETLLGWGEELADTFIKWRDADEAEAKRRICKK